MRVAIIPARGGSKRIPRKNIRNFCGKPIISWSIQVARSSGLFDHVIVSTDDEEIAQVAVTHGGEVPFLRPAELADDHTGTTDVIAHGTRWCLDQGWPVDAVCCIYATAPFLRAEDLQQGFALLTSGSWSFTFTATEYASSIFRAFRQRSDGSVEMFFPEHFTSRSQDLPVALHDAGQFYWGRADAWLAQKRLFDRQSSPVVLPRWRVQDIDTEDDWRRAEIIQMAIIGGY